MLVQTLIDKAKEKSQLSQEQLASAMGIAKSNFSNWKKGDHTPSPVHTAFLATLAGVDPLMAIAEIEAEKKPTSENLWVAAGVKLGGDGGIVNLLNNKEMRYRYHDSSHLFDLATDHHNSRTNSVTLNDQAQQKQKPQLRKQPGLSHVIGERDVKEQPLNSNVTSNY
jgi:hypothetical protein